MTDTVQTEQPVARGALVFYFNVGNLPPYKAEAFIERLKDQWGQNVRSHGATLPPDVVTYFIPVRPPQETYVDFVPFAVTEEELLADLDREDIDALDEHAAEFLHELNLTNPRGGCCQGEKTACCQKPEEDGFFKRLCKKVFGGGCCS